MVGPLASYGAGFHAQLVALGYAQRSAENQVLLMSQVSRWMAEHSLTTDDLVPEVIDQFLATRRSEGRNERMSPAGLSRLIGYLRTLSVVPVINESTTDLDRLLGRYQTYLATERGLAPGTVRPYLAAARLFLSQRGTPNDLRLDDLTPGQVNAFVVREVHARRSGRYIATGTRALLRFLHVQGRIASPLALVVPSMAHWRLRSLPKALDRDQVDRLLASCGRGTPHGLRDFAILTVLARLGLRAGEVAELKVHDVDWRRGEVVVHGKGSREECLPLPVDVGEAIVDWLLHGRPRCKDPHLFTRIPAPHAGITSIAVTSVVRAACRRAGLPVTGAHALRHTVATMMLRTGAGLPEIGQVLRHRSIATTAIYAKVDRASLSS